MLLRLMMPAPGTGAVEQAWAPHLQDYMDQVGQRDDRAFFAAAALCFIVPVGAKLLHKLTASRSVFNFSMLHAKLPATAHATELRAPRPPMSKG